MDVQLRDWSQHELPQLCVQVGWEVLYDELERAAKEAEHSRGYDHIFDKLKKEVITQTRDRHQWDSKAITRLVSIVTISYGQGNGWFPCLAFKNYLSMSMRKCSFCLLKRVFGAFPLK